jgi:hypothetical protein
MAIDCIAEIPGAVELSNWFGGFPSFHDAKMQLQINSDGTGWLKAYGMRMTREVDAAGFFVSDRHFVATFQFGSIESVSITDFLPGLAILGELHIRKMGPAFEVDFGDTAYGLSGSLICKEIGLTFEPGVKAP